MKTLNDRIKESILRNPSYSDYQIAKNFRGASTALVKSLREGSPAPETPEAPVKGVQLSRLRVLSRRPSESAAKFIRRLPNGRGFSVSDLSREWGMSEETIRKHARDLGCLKFVEITEDEWVPMVMNPETAASYAV